MRSTRGCIEKRFEGRIHRLAPRVNRDKWIVLDSDDPEFSKSRHDGCQHASRTFGARFQVWALSTSAHRERAQNLVCEFELALACFVDTWRP